MPLDRPLTGCILSAGASSIIEGGATIGIKGKHIEWARLEGRGCSSERLWAGLGRFCSPSSEAGWYREESAYDSRSSGVHGNQGRWGSQALGLSECAYTWQLRWGYLGGCSLGFVRARQGNVPYDDRDQPHTAVAVPGALR